MELYPFEATNGMNWGRFAVGRPVEEWAWPVRLDQDSEVPLLQQTGWGYAHVWVTDLVTGEGAIFRHGGNAGADLDKHRIWVCPLFEPFLAWLYRQDVLGRGKLAALHERHPVVEFTVEQAPFEMFGYRRPGLLADEQPEERAGHVESVEQIEQVQQ